jgi:hypothetical protein
LDAGAGAVVVSRNTGPCARISVVRAAGADEVGVGGLDCARDAGAVAILIRGATAAILANGALGLGAGLACASFLEVAAVAGPRAIVGVEGGACGLIRGVAGNGVRAWLAPAVRIGSTRTSVESNGARKQAAQ